MNVAIHQENKSLLFKIENQGKAVVYADGPEELGGENGGLRPMELLLSALATCSAFDIVQILKKQRQEISDFSIEVNGHREKKGDVNPFQAIEMIFSFTGENLKEEKVKRAVELSVDKYCSVRASLHPDIRITYRSNIQ